MGKFLKKISGEVGKSKKEMISYMKFLLHIFTNYFYKIYNKIYKIHYFVVISSELLQTSGS